MFFVGNITGADGVDTVNIDGNVTGNVDTGSGDDVINHNSGTLTGNVDSGIGNDTVSIASNLTGSLTTGAGNDNVTITSNLNGSLTTDAGDDTVVISSTITGTTNTGDGNDTVTVNNGANLASSVNSGAGNDTFNFNGGSVSGALTAGTGDNTYNHNGGAVTSAINVTGNDILNHRNGVQFGNSLTGTGAFQVANANGNVATDLIIGTDYLVPDVSAFAGHYIIGGTIDTPDLPLDGSKTVDINTALMTVESPILTNGDITLLAQNITLASPNNNTPGIRARGPGPTGGQVTLVAAGDGTTGGNITGPDTGFFQLQGGFGLFVATNNIINGNQLNLDFDQQDIVISLGEGQEAPTIGQLDANVTEGDDNVTGFLSGATINIAGFGVTALNVEVNLDVSQANLAGNLIGLEQLAFIDVGLFEEDLSLFGVIGNGVAPVTGPV